MLLNLAAFCLLCLVAILQPIAAYASPLEGITISPSTSQISLPETTRQKKVPIFITNNSASAIELQINTQDFGALEETGGLFFMGSKPSKPWDAHRLKNWLQVYPSTLSLLPGETKPISLTISNGSDLAPGGHYAAVVATLISQNDASDLAINPAVSSLIFLNKKGGDVLGIQLKTLQADIAWWGQPRYVTIKFTNTGNTHVVPRGTVVIKGPLGSQIARGIINQTSTAILPNTKQDFKVTLIQSMPAWLPGLYTINVTYRYDGQDVPITQSKSVFEVGLGVLIILIVGILVAIGWLWRRKSA